MQEQNASLINLMLLLALSYLLHKSNIMQLGIFSIQLLIIEIHQSFPHSNNRIIQINPLLCILFIQLYQVQNNSFVYID